MIERICKILEMPLKDDKETENIPTIVVKNEDIHENDVLMGRGGKNNRHVGNEKLRDIARGQVDKYKVSTKKIKSAMSRDIVRKVRTQDPPGRFLKRIPETGDWEDVGDYLAREKVAQVLRDAVCEATEATVPTIHPSVQPPGASPYMTYPDGRVAAGVFRQGPVPGMDPMLMDGEQSRRSVAIPGVVTASPSSSFGHPPAYAMPRPWHRYGAQHPQFSQPPYPGMPQPPFPPGYPPPHSPHFSPSAAAHPAYAPATHTSSPRRTSAEDLTLPKYEATTNDMGTSASGQRSSISPSGASETFAGATQSEAVTSKPEAATTPLNGRGRRKRSRSLPEESLETPQHSGSIRASGSSGSKSPSKRSSATQTPPFFDGPRRGNPLTPMAAQAPPHPWDYATRPTVAAYHRGSPVASQERFYFERHSQHYYEQSMYFPQPHPPIRSYSAPLPRGPVGTEPHDSDSSTGSAANRTRLTTSPSSPEVRRRTTRPAASGDSFEPIVPPEQPGGSGTMEPLPVHQGVDGPGLVAAPTALPKPPRAIANMRRGGKTNPPQNPSGTDAELGLDWFQGELLLESDEETEEGNRGSYPV